MRLISIEFQHPNVQQRTAEIKPFLKKKGVMETNPTALDEYRRK
jgi:hypothetical protein